MLENSYEKAAMKLGKYLVLVVNARGCCQSERSFKFSVFPKIKIRKI
jgi:predicted alpha/beta-fold hydrolase